MDSTYNTLVGKVNSWKNLAASLTRLFDSSKLIKTVRKKQTADQKTEGQEDSRMTGVSLPFYFVDGRSGQGAEN